MSEHLDRYLQGWVKGDVDMMVSACAEDFVMDDPVFGRFTKAEYRAYFEGQGEETAEFSEVVISEVGGLETQWGWYKQASFEGAFLNKAGPEGVHSTKITYFAPAPEISPKR
jgi:hypothetical protein